MLASRGFLRSAAAALRSHAPLRFFGAAPGGGIPGNLEHAVGLERAEAEALAQGKDLFEPQLVGPFGTKEHPVVVESIHHERIVGCPGHCADGDTSNNNEIRWFKVTSKAPFVCADCGQVWSPTLPFANAFVPFPAAMIVHSAALASSVHYTCLP
jgi:hypothetical protein